MQVIKKYCPRFHRILVKVENGQLVYYNQWWFIWWHYYWHEIGYQCMAPETYPTLINALWNFYFMRKTKNPEFYEEMQSWAYKQHEIWNRKLKIENEFSST